MKNQNPAVIENVTITEELKPLVQQLDAACSRLELIESFAEVFYLWRKHDELEVTVSTRTLASLGAFLRREAFELRHEISGDVMDKLSIIGKLKEVSDDGDNQ